jgi:aromatic ring-opening dioxygenase catalytic subunit (LigB family)
MKEVRRKWLPKQDPSAIVVLSAHWESDPIKITLSSKPSLVFDYGGFPPETYEYQYPAPGDPEIARKIGNLLDKEGISNELDEKRGLDHGVFVPLMIMFPEAKIPVVEVSLHNSLSPDINMQVGKALAPLRDENILILGSGYTFHNMHAFFNPSDATYKASVNFNNWLKEILTGSGHDVLSELKEWPKAPGARLCHPREEHLLPLLMTAATSFENQTSATLIYDADAGNGEHAISAYLFN